jgi:ureidoacrylate peracid hydrolase
MNRESLGQWVGPKKCALLVIDVQNDFCHPEGGLGRRGYDLSMIPGMVPPLRDLIRCARKTSIPVIHIRLARKTLGEWPAMDRLFRSQFGDDYIRLVEEGSWGAEYYDEEIVPEAGEIVVTKPRYGAFAETELDGVLKKLGVTGLILTGVATNVCVESTAREGFMRDYDIVVVSDCCAGVSRARHDATLENIGLHFGLVAAAEEVVKEWTQAADSLPRRKEARA